MSITLNMYTAPLTAAEWASDNPVLRFGEMARDSDTGRIKFGDGSTAWTGLPYVDQGSGGSVTSVAVSVPSFLSVSGSPVTTSGTIAIDLATQVANKLFAGPSSGADAAPTFRTIVLADIPDAALGTGTPSSTKVLYGNRTWGALPSSTNDDPRLMTVFLPTDFTDNTSSTTDITDFYLSLEPDKIYVVRALVRFETDNAACGVAFSLRGPIGSDLARKQDLHTMVPISVSSIVDRLSNNTHETGSLTTSAVISPTNTVFLAEVSALVITVAGGGSGGGAGQYFLAMCGNGGGTVTVRAGSAMFSIEIGDY